MDRNLHRDALVVAAALGMAVSNASAGPEDHTRRGLGRSSTPPPPPPPPAQAPQQPAAPAPAPNPGTSTPNQNTPAASAPAAADPSPAPTGGSGGLVRSPGSTTAGDGRPPRIGTPQNPATVDETRRALGLPMKSSARRVAGSIDLPSGAETMRAHQGGLLRSSPSAGNGPGAAAGAVSPRSGESGSAFRRLTDNTARDLNRSRTVQNYWHSHGSDEWRHRGWRGPRDSWHGERWTQGGWSGYSEPSFTQFDPWTHWSSGLDFGSIDPYTGFANEPWSYTRFNYGGPGWFASNDWSVRPYQFSYHPYLGEDVWVYESTTYSTSGGMFADPFAVGDFSGGLTGTPRTEVAAGPTSPPSTSSQIYTTHLPRVNTSYDVRSDLQNSVEAALGGEYSAAIYSMRRAAGVNPSGLTSGNSAARADIANNPAWGQRVRAALLVFQNPPTRVVSETDAQFMVAALSAAMGDESSARNAIAAALRAGDAATSTALLSKALYGEPLETSGPWVTGRRVGK